ncbi:hypothetical protein [Antarctic microvirus CAA_003_V_1]|nr:hypothetical protein [Antarctic microvirus CAA_003_V_1]
MTNYNTSFTYDFTQQKYEINTQPSETIPDQSMSVDEIMRRYAQGLPMSGERVPTYEDPEIETMPDLSKMDLADREQVIKSYTKEIQEIRESHEKTQTAKAAKKQKHDFDEAVKIATKNHQDEKQ